MKVIHFVLGKANPERMNGVNKVAHSLATCQTKLGHQVAVWGITPTPNHEIADRAYTVQLFQATPNKFTIHHSIREAIAAVKDKKTIFHIHGAFIPEFFHIAKLLKANALSYVFTPHGAYNAFAMRKNYIIKLLYLKTLELFLLTHAKAVHLLGKSEEEGLCQHTYLNNQVLIPNGQDLTEIDKYFPSPDPKKDNLIFGYCGRISAFHKGLDLLIQGFSLYKFNHGKGKLWLIGDGEDSLSLKNTVQELGLSEDVLFLGSKFGEEKFNLLVQMDFFVHTSRFEGIPTAVLEAAALAKPCLLTEGTNLMQYVQEYQAGIPISINTPEMICNALKEGEAMYLHNKHLVVGNNARKMVETVFTWESVCQKLDEVYQV